jgi:hypothetical protein
MEVARLTLLTCGCMDGAYGVCLLPGEAAV